MSGPDATRGKDFLAKSEKWIGWLDDDHEGMISSAKVGDFPQIERHFVNVLLRLDSVHQSLLDAAKKFEQAPWRSELEELRNTDPLLSYMWNARRSEAHDAVLKWRPSMKHLEFEIVLPETARVIQIGAPNQFVAAQRLILRAYGVTSTDGLIEKMTAGFVPSPSQQLMAGIQLKLSHDSLALDQFHMRAGGKPQLVEPPEQHLGKALPPSATEATRLAIEFYRSKHTELAAAVAEA